MRPKRAKTWTENVRRGVVESTHSWSTLKPIPGLMQKVAHTLWGDAVVEHDAEGQQLQQVAHTL